MKNILILISLLCIAITTHGQKVLDTGYFIFTEEGFQKLEQSRDTIYIYRCFTNLSCPQKPYRHYKILATQKLSEYTVLKVERLDSIPLTPDPYPADRYLAVAFHRVNKKTLSYITEPKHYTKTQIDTLNLKQSYLESRFSLTYYTQPFLTELNKLKPITTKEEIEKILLLFKTPEYQKIVQKHKDSDVPDMYNLNLMYELWHKAVIESGYNPHGAIKKFNQLMK